jgi:NADPH2:quinone reductase
MEAVGRIDSVGEGVTDRAVGARVICGMQHGAYAERVVVSAAQSWPAFDDFDVDENAAYGVNFLTAWVALVEMARLLPTDRVAITAAGGGVGTAAVQIAHATGCHVVGLAGSDEKEAVVRALGAHDFVNYRGDGWADRLAGVVGPEGLDVVLEVVGGEVYRACLDALAPFGRLVVAGYAGLDYSLWNPLSWWRAWRDAPRLSITDAAVASVGVMATHVGYLIDDEARLVRTWTALSDFTRRHGLRPQVGATFPFEELPEAHRLMESRRSRGKIVVRVD